MLVKTYIKHKSKLLYDVKRRRNLKNRYFVNIVIGVLTDLCSKKKDAGLLNILRALIVCYASYHYLLLRRLVRLVLWL